MQSSVDLHNDITDTDVTLENVSSYKIEADGKTTEYTNFDALIPLLMAKDDYIISFYERGRRVGDLYNQDWTVVRAYNN